MRLLFDQQFSVWHIFHFGKYVRQMRWQHRLWSTIINIIVVWSVALLHEFIKYFSVERAATQRFLFCMTSRSGERKRDENPIKPQPDVDGNSGKPEKF